MQVCFVRASRQNVFFDELMDAFRGGLERHGIEVETATDHFPPVSQDLVYVFVPHEFMAGVEPDAHPTPRQCKRSVAICTEQPGTAWFRDAATVAAMCGAAVDINEIGVRALRDHGVPAELLRLGYVPAWDRWGGVDDSPREIDLTFMGGHTPRRGQAVASLGPVMQHRRASLHLFETRPHLADDPHFLSGDRKWDLLRDSKAILNIHRSELGYMEWQRVVGAMINGCVVVSEHSIAYQPLVPGEHFVSARFDDLALVTDALLCDPGRLKTIRRQAYAYIKDQFPMDEPIRVLCNALERVARAPVSTPAAGEPTAVPRPRADSSPEPAYSRYREADPEALGRMALKQLLLEVRALRDQAQGDAEPPHIVERFGDHSASPRVSVVVTLFNYAHLVEEALMSVARSEHDAVELIVIDDASTDDSVEVARDTLASVPWLPSRLVRRGRNRGLAEARNLGFELARSELVFVLDADNAVYPRAFSLLEQALDRNPDACFAYGMIEMFDEQGPVDVMSYLGWDPSRLRHGNYIDAMAMIRRDSVLKTASGYVTDSELHGWEDFALWCALASKGCEGARVPEIVARYRTSPHSMISLTNIDASAAWANLRQRYPVLSGKQPVASKRTLGRSKRLGDAPADRSAHGAELG